MPIYINNLETEELASELACLTGESVTSVIHSALAERYARLSRRRPGSMLCDALGEIARRCADRPVLRALSDDEILGYDETGTPSPAKCDTE